MHIGHGVTISAPHMHAMCLEVLRDHLRPGIVNNCISYYYLYAFSLLVI